MVDSCEHRLSVQEGTCIDIPAPRQRHARARIEYACNMLRRTVYCINIYIIFSLRAIWCSQSNNIADCVSL